MSQSRSSRPAAPGEGTPKSIRRRPHRGAGPCLPIGGRRPGRRGHRGPRSAAIPSVVATTLILSVVIAGVALLAACGSAPGPVASASAAPTPVPRSSGASATSAPASAAPTPVPSPLITSGPPPAGAIAVVREFWTLAGSGRLGDAQRSLVARGSPILQWTGEDIAAARFVRLVPRSVSRGPAEGATIEFAVTVWIDPGSQPGPWGDAGEHQLFEHVVRMSDATWRMWDSGTGP